MQRLIILLALGMAVMQPAFAQNTTFPIGAYHTFQSWGQPGKANIDLDAMDEIASAGLTVGFGGPYYADPLLYQAMLDAAEASGMRMIVDSSPAHGYLNSGFLHTRFEAEDIMSGGSAHADAQASNGLLYSVSPGSSIETDNSRPQPLLLFETHGCDEYADGIASNNGDGLCDDGEVFRAPHQLRALLSDELAADPTGETLTTLRFEIRYRKSASDTEGRINVRVCQYEACYHPRNAIVDVERMAGYHMAVFETPTQPGWYPLDVQIENMSQASLDIDYIEISNVYGRRMRAGEFDDDIRTRLQPLASTLSSHPAVLRMAVGDEPEMSALLSHERIAGHFKALTGRQPYTALDFGRALYTEADLPLLRLKAERYFDYSGSDLIAPDPYLLLNSVPSPEYPQGDGTVGIPAMTLADVPGYQTRIREGLLATSYVFQAAREVADARNGTVWGVTSAHGVWALPHGQERHLYTSRPPTSGETAAAAFVALANGVDGLMYWVYKTQCSTLNSTVCGSVGLVDGSQGHDTETDMFVYGEGAREVYTGYATRWAGFKRLNTRIARFKDLLPHLSVARKFHPGQRYAGSYIAAIAEGGGYAEDVYLTTFRHDHQPQGAYFMLVNAETVRPDGTLTPRRLRVHFVQLADGVPACVADLGSDDVYTVVEDDLGGYFDVDFEPGFGSLFRIVPCTVDKSVYGAHTEGELNLAAGRDLQTAFTLAPGTAARYRGGRSVELLEGTHVQAGARLDAYLRPCKVPETSVPESSGYLNARAAGSERPVLESEASASGAATVQAYPNPFNPAATVRFSLPAEQGVRIAVYDLLGRLVETLVDGSLPEGGHTVRWHAGTFPSGVYLIRMHTETQTLTERVTLAK